jgi:HEPN domain-containing protein
MKKARLMIGIRRGLYDSETEMYSVPACFDSEQSAQRALKSLAAELSGLTDVELAVTRQLMVSLRPETYERYDEAGEFPRLYEAKKDEFHGYVIQIDVPDTEELKETARKIVHRHSLQVIDEGPAKEKTLIFIS